MIYSFTMYHSFLTFTFLATFILTRDTSACMHYTAIFPYSTSLPFEATLTDNGIVTCWLSMTYDQHNDQQIAFSQHRHHQPTKRYSLTGEPDLSMISSPTKSENQKGSGGQAELKEREQGGKWAADEDDGAGVWLPWEFDCLKGYEAHAGIGLRAVWYMAHGQEFEFVPDLYEDVLGDKWVYTVNLWCGDGS
jgi:hypothetical protein